jgi:hypothetical protein
MERGELLKQNQCRREIKDGGTWHMSWRLMRNDKHRRESRIEGLIIDVGRIR